MTIEDIMSKKVITAHTRDRLYEIAELMDKNNIGFIPLIKRNNLVGVITDRDIVINAVNNSARSSAKVENYMTEELITVNKEDSLEKVYDLMKNHQVSRIIVLEGKDVVGIISIHDLITKGIDDDIILDIIKALKKK